MHAWIREHDLFIVNFPYKNSAFLKQPVQDTNFLKESLEKEIVLLPYTSLHA